MMKFNRTTFFAYARPAPFGGRLSQDQVDGCTRILDEWEKRGLADDRWLANMLAQTFHETAHTMQPVRETLSSSDDGAVARLEKAWKAGRLRGVSNPYWRKDPLSRSYFGRGLIQITHPSNYAKFGLSDDPAAALLWPNALRILFDGMIDGMFTGAKLSDYFNDHADDPIGARKIVNGKDKARLIAGYHTAFLGALKAASNATPQPTDVKPEDAKPDDKPAVESTPVMTMAGAFTSGATALPFLGNINNAWALGAFALLVVAGGIAAYLFISGRITVNRKVSP